MSQWTKDTLSRITSLLLVYVLVVATLWIVPHGKGQAINNGTPTYTTGADACGANNTQPANKAVAIAGGTATTTLLVALSAGKQIFLCEWTLLVGVSSTTATAVQFEYGTQTTNPCDTGTTVLTGVMGSFTTTAGPAIMLVNGPYSGSTFVVPAGNQLCLVTTGPAAGINVGGQITYKQL
jgi:hypothetical protein